MVSCKEIVNSIKKNVVRIEISVQGKEGNGSGIVIDKEGTLVTCEHIVRPNGLIPDSLRVTKDGESYETEIVRLDRNRDIALLRVIGIQGKCSFKKYNDVEIGDEGFVLGYPLGITHLTVLPCVVSAKGKHLVSGFPYKLIQIDARVNRGNSGGPVLDSNKGEVIGITSMKYIPFLLSVEELQRYVRKIPRAPESARGGIRFGGVDWWTFFNYVNESVNRLADALMMVQVGIGWVIPSDLILDNLHMP